MNGHRSFGCFLTFFKKVGHVKPQVSVQGSFFCHSYPWVISCGCRLLTEMKTGDDETTRTFRARRVRDLLKVYDPALVEVLSLGLNLRAQCFFV